MRPEDRLQSRCRMFLDACLLPPCWWSSIAHERKQTPRQGQMQKARGVKAGLADELGTHEAAERGLEQVMSKAPEAPQAPAPTAALDPTQALLARLGGDPAKALNRLAELELDAASAKALQGEVEKLKAAQPDRKQLALAQARAANLAPAQLGVLESFAADPAVSADVLEAQVKRLVPPVHALQSKPYEPAAGAPSPSAPVGTPPAVALSNYDRALFAAAGIPTAEHEKVKQQGAAAVARLQERR